MDHSFCEELDFEIFPKLKRSKTESVLQAHFRKFINPYNFQECDRFFA